MLDRSQPPKYIIPEDFSLTQPEHFELSSGAKVYFIPTPAVEAVKIEFLGNGTRANLPLTRSLVPSFTLQLLPEGTSQKSGTEIAHFFDFHASELQPIISFGNEGFSLISTKKHIFEILPVALELVHEAIFPEEILIKKKSQRKLSIQLEREKTSSRASQLFRKALFGDTHPYGVVVEESMLEEITSERLLQHSQTQLWQNLEIFISGNFSEPELSKLLQHLEKFPVRPLLEKVLLPETSSEYFLHEERAESLQSSIRMGDFSIPKNHSDFIPLLVFNSILGGYFGSRLIKNIREDKGHTYGIYSSLAQIGDLNYWVISADVEKKYLQTVKSEIKKEIQTLCEEPVPQDELELVRNYLLGQMLSQFSNSFDLMDRFRAVHHAGMTLGFYQQKLNFLKEFNQGHILEIGEKYFKDKAIFEVSVG
ncbi:insulinase family protein [Algoriphagus kandeliae]|uniref:Insulinase family protein n=1 Tax=Algoriphagus kandeliae TaxID=2562278 RepID=A0A4Y9QP43_9BACT|nr:pitrilysin family protein [Algoriphagus kandeliae]TFV94401.1 insulinase family protein [Algoriphagus kandeliae]